MTVCYHCKWPATDGLLRQFCDTPGCPNGPPGVAPAQPLVQPSLIQALDPEWYCWVHVDGMPPQPNSAIHPLRRSMVGRLCVRLQRTPAGYMLAEYCTEGATLILRGLSHDRQTVVY